MGNVEKFLQEIKVYDCDLTKVRIGNKHDGSYIALEELCEKTSMVYSFGIGDDVGFEVDFARRFPRSKFKLFDPTIDRLPLEHPKFEFLKQDIGQGKGEPFKSVAENSLLKMDVEHNEWEPLLAMNNEQFNKFNQIIIEFHVVSVATNGCYPETKKRTFLSPYFKTFYRSIANNINEDLFGAYYEVMRKLNEQFYAFHVHANNSLPKINTGGYTFPPLLEISFVRKDLVRVHKTATNFPTEGLDFPNKTDRPDIVDWYPLGKKIKGGIIKRKVMGII